MSRKDKENFVAGIYYTDRDDLLQKCEAIGIRLHSIPEGGYNFEQNQYSIEWFKSHSRAPIVRFPDLEQPAQTIIDGIPVSVSIEQRYIRFSISGMEKPFYVTEKDVAACEQIEKRFDNLGWRNRLYHAFASYPDYIRPGIGRRHDAKTFPIVVSTPSRRLDERFARLFTRSMFVFCGIVIVLMAISTTLYTNLYTAFALLILAFPIGFFLWKLRNAHTHIRVDEEGVHYIHRPRNKTIRTVKWEDFRPSPEQMYDVYMSTRYLVSLSLFVTVPHLVWYEQRQGKVVKHKETFGSIHFWYIGMDTTVLRQAFLKGLWQFRPDITVHPDVFVQNT